MGQSVEAGAVAEIYVDVFTPTTLMHAVFATQHTGSRVILPDELGHKNVEKSSYHGTIERIVKISIAISRQFIKSRAK